MEAIYHGVPLVGIPIFADQKFNMDTAMEAGYAITLDFTRLDGDALYEAINSCIDQPR